MTLAEQNDELFRKYKECPSKELKLEIFFLNEKLVTKAAQKYFTRSDYEDLLQEGHVGLWVAIDRFDPDVSAFSTFAMHYIKGYMKRGMQYSHLIHIPNNVYLETGKLKRKRQALELEQGNRLTDKQIMETCHLKPEEYQLYRWVENITSPLSLDIPLVSDRGEVDEISLVDTLCARKPPVDCALLNEAKKKALLEVVHEAAYDSLSATPEQKQMKYDVFCWYMGLDGSDPVTFQEMADKLGVAKQGIHKKVADMMRRLNSPMYRSKLRYLLDVPTDMKDTDITTYVFHNAEEVPADERDFG